MNDLLTVKQVADRIGCSISTIYAWGKHGKIPAYKLGGTVRFDPAEVEEWIRQNKVKPPDMDAVVDKILKSTREVDIDAVVRNAIDSENGAGYNSL